VWHRGLEPGSRSAAYTIAGPFTASKGAAQFLNSHSSQTLRCAEGTGVLASVWQTVFQGSASVREAYSQVDVIVTIWSSATLHIHLYVASIHALQFLFKVQPVLDECSLRTAQTLGCRSTVDEC
jgi:hypothetical protein